MSGATLAWVLSCWLLACTKETSTSSKSNTSAPTLALSTQSVKQGQPLVASLPAGVVATSVRWSVNPDSTARVKLDSGHATILFTRGGQYRISASYATGTDTTKRDSCYGIITVSDSVYTPPPPPPPYKPYDTVGIDGDSVHITPILDSTGRLALLAQSTRGYGCYPYYLYSTSASVSSGIALQFDFVVVANGNTCGGSRQPAWSNISLGSISGWANGTYPLSIKYYGTTYSGSLKITATDYTFTWNDSTRVFMSPLHVNR